MSNEQSWTNHLFSSSVCLDVQCARHMDRDANKEWVAVRNEWPKSAMFEDLEVPIAKRASGVLWFLTCSYLPAVKKWQRPKHWPTGINCGAVQAHLRSVELWAQLWFGKYSQDLMIIPVKIAKIGATLGISVARGPLLDTQIHGLTRFFSQLWMVKSPNVQHFLGHTQPGFPPYQETNQASTPCVLASRYLARALWRIGKGWSIMSISDWFFFTSPSYWLGRAEGVLQKICSRGCIYIYIHIYIYIWYMFLQ